MSVRGMWTKRYTGDGKEFWFNATLNKSAWRPPAESVTHEADQLKNPAAMSPKSLEAWKNEIAALNFSGSGNELFHFSQLNVLFTGIDELILPASVPVAAGAALEASAVDVGPAISVPDRGQVDVRPAESPEPESLDAMNERVNAVAFQKQQAMRSKRFKAHDGSQDKEKTEYEKMVSEYQSISGTNADDNCKWFVR